MGAAAPVHLVVTRFSKTLQSEIVQKEVATKTRRQKQVQRVAQTLHSRTWLSAFSSSWLDYSKEDEREE